MDLLNLQVSHVAESVEGAFETTGVALSSMSDYARRLVRSLDSSGLVGHVYVTDDNNVFYSHRCADGTLVLHRFSDAPKAVNLAGYTLIVFCPGSEKGTPALVTSQSRCPIETSLNAAGRMQQRLSKLMGLIFVLPVGRDGQWV